MTEVVLPTAGGCMRPWIWPNGKLHVEVCTIDQLRLGDIAVWLDRTNFVAHRVVVLGVDELSTRSDSSRNDDPPVQPNQLLGRAVRFTRGPVSYRLDSPLVVGLTRMGRAPWARLMSAARWGRNRLSDARAWVASGRRDPQSPRMRRRE
jgi:hypothetical protein